MSGILETLSAIAVFLVGLAARIGIVVVVMLALLVPVALALGAVRGFRALRLWAQGYRTAGGGLRFRNGLLYAPGHTWIRPEGTRLRLGIDDLAQALFPWAVAVELPSPGQKVKEGEPVALISTGVQQAHVAAPLSGTIVAVNPAVVREPTLLKTHGYGRGWLVAIEPDDRSWRDLPTGEVARGWMRAEAGRLARFYEQQLGFAATDGGVLLAPPPSLLGEAQWKALTKAFLRA